MTINQYFCCLLINRLQFNPLKHTAYVVLRCTQFPSMLVTQIALVRLLAKPHCNQHSLWAFNMSPFIQFRPLINNFKLHSNSKMVSKVFYKVLNMHNNNKVLSKVVSKVPNMHNINTVVFKVAFL